MVHRLSFIVHRILNLLNPQLPVGGLQITDSAVRFVLAKNSASSFVSLKLPDGVVEEGKVKDKDGLKEALIKLHSQITPHAKKQIYAVLNVSENNVYGQVFNLPLAALENLEEAVRLNLQMISPIDFGSAYSDWQKVGENAIDGGQLEILGAFAGSKIIDEFIECLTAANFTAVAVEFSSLAISRLASGLENLPQASLLLHLCVDGLNFSLIKNYNLYFSHFVPWPSLENRKIPLAAVKEILIRETKNLLNFAASRWSDVQINSLVLATPTLEEKLSEIITENFPLSVKKMILPSKLKNHKSNWSLEDNQFPALSSDWFVVLGSALRGMLPRSKDILISLSSTGTEEKFRQDKIIGFINSWRNVVLTSLFFITIVFGLVDNFLAKTAGFLNAQLSDIADFTGQTKITELQKQANDSNVKVNLALAAKNQASQWSPFFEKIKNLAGSDISIERIFIQSADSVVLFGGQAINDQSIVDFKNRMAKDPQFLEINFPVSSVVQTLDGKLSFSLTFKLK